MDEKGASTDLLPVAQCSLNRVYMSGQLFLSKGQKG